MDLLAICMPIFMIIILGNVLLRLNLIDHVFIDSSNRLVMNIFLPILLFNQIAKSNFNEVFSHKHVIILLSSVLIILLISFPLARLLKLPDEATPTFISNNYRSNASFVGLPVCFYAFGNQGLAIASIYLAFMAPINNLLTILVYNISGHHRSGIKEILKETFLNPLMISCTLGIIFSLSQITLPDFVERTLAILGGVALPLALFGIGVTINLQCIKGNKNIITITSLMKLFLLPMTAFMLFKIFAVQNFGILEQVAIILLASPSAQANYIFAYAMEGDPDLASGGIVLSTVLSAVAFVIWLSVMA